MTDIERLVRETLARHESEVPLLDAVDVRPMSARARRRQVWNIVGASLVALVIALATVGGVGALLSAEAPEPATRPTPSPTEPGGELEPPPEAPIVVDSGTGRRLLARPDRGEGWAWVLSSSADGRCIALTDEQGSEVNCSGPSGDAIDAYVRSPRPPAPDIAFVFGRLPKETETVQLYVPSRHTTTGETYFTSYEMHPQHDLFVGSIEGHGYPWVPDVLVQAVVDGTVVASRQLERPAWAREPVTVLETVATGTHALHPFGWNGVPEPWEIDVFRDERTGEVCLGEPGREAACGTAEDPVAGWLSTWPTFERVNTDSGVMGFGASVQFMWGVFRDPVASIEVELLDAAGMSPGWHTVPPQIYGLPPGYGDALSIFVVDCDCGGVRVHLLASDGREIGRERIW